MAGFPNPLPDTLYLLLVGLFVYACVFGRAYACLPGCSYLCLAARTCVSRAVGRLRQPSTPVHWFRAHGLRMRKLHCYRVEFSRLTCVSRTESDWNSRMYCLVPVRDLATPLATQFGPLTNSSGSTFAPLSPLPTKFGPLGTVPLPLGSRYT